MSEPRDLPAGKVNPSTENPKAEAPTARMSADPHNLSTPSGQVRIGSPMVADDGQDDLMQLEMESDAILNLKERGLEMEKVQVGKYSLRFTLDGKLDENLWHSFSKFLALRYKYLVWITTILLVCLNFFMILYDYDRFYSDDEQLFWGIIFMRFGAIFPSCCFVLYYCQSDHFEKHPNFLAIPVAVVGTCIVLYGMLGRNPGYGTLALFLTYVLNFTPTIFWIAFGLCSLMNLLFTILIYAVDNEVESGDRFSYVGVIWIFFLFAAFVAHKLRYQFCVGHLAQVTLQCRHDDLINEKSRSAGLLRSMLPDAIVNHLENRSNSRSPIARGYPQVTVLFLEISHFSSFTSMLKPASIVALLNVIYSEFDRLTDLHDVYKVETVGQIYMVVSGCPNEAENHADLAANFALDVLARLKKLRRIVKDKVGDIHGELDIRIGLNTGPIVAGVVGMKNPRFKLFGDTVNVSSRMESTGELNRIQVTTSTYERLQDRYNLESRGKIPVKGRGLMQTYFLVGRLEGDVVPERRQSLTLADAAALLPGDFPEDGRGQKSFFRPSGRSDLLTPIAPVHFEGDSSSENVLTSEEDSSTGERSPTSRRRRSIKKKESRLTRLKESMSKLNDFVPNLQSVFGISNLGDDEASPDEPGLKLPYALEHVITFCMPNDSYLSTSWFSRGLSKCCGWGPVPNDVAEELPALFDTKIKGVKRDAAVVKKEKKLFRSPNASRSQDLHERSRLLREHPFLLEQDFQREYRVADEWLLRAALIIGSAITALLFLQDLGRHWEDEKDILWQKGIVRAISIILLMVLLPFTFSKTRFERYKRTIAGVILLLFGLGVVAISVLGKHPGYGMLALLIVFSYSLRLVPLIARIFIFAIWIVVYIASILLFNDDVIDTGDAVQHLGYLLVFFFAQAVPTFISEATLRRNYYRSKCLERQGRKLDIQKERSNKLLQNLFPMDVLERLKNGSSLVADTFASVTILFLDMKGFTNFASTVSPNHLVLFLNTVYQYYDEILEKHSLYKVEVIGDAYFVVGGCTDPVCTCHAVRCAHAAVDIIDAMPDIRAMTNSDIRVRIGLHTGPVVAGVVGLKDPRYHLFGETVVVAEKMESEGVPSRVHCSFTTAKALTDTFQLEERENKIAVGNNAFMKTYLIAQSICDEQEALKRCHTKRTLLEIGKRGGLGAPQARFTLNRMVSLKSHLRTYDTETTQSSEDELGEEDLEIVVEPQDLEDSEIVIADRSQSPMDSDLVQHSGSVDEKGVKLEALSPTTLATTPPQVGHSVSESGDSALEGEKPPGRKRRHKSKKPKTPLAKLPRKATWADLVEACKEEKK